MMGRDSYADAIEVLELSSGAYADLIASPFADELAAGRPATTILLVAGDPEPDLPPPGSLPVVVVWAGERLGGEGPPVADLVAGLDDIEALVRTIGAAPLAAQSLAVLLRSQDRLDVEAGLAAESSVYSLLQAGPEFAAWRARRPQRAMVAEDHAVLSERDGATLTITLDRPHRRNAITAQLRDELAIALAVAIVDDSIQRVVLRGSGGSFSAGGDLDEFGLRPDPATAHVTRLARSPARLIDKLSRRTVANIGGATLGGGIELAAFATTVVAAANTEIGLPEIELGLIPGAGGTVSITRRIGRQRTAALALTARRIDARTALAWGLVDAIEPPPA
jgi:enoyl-CoA hydratase/carnithine racemase